MNINIVCIYFYKDAILTRNNITFILDMYTFFSLVIEISNGACCLGAKALNVLNLILNSPDLQNFFSNSVNSGACEYFFMYYMPYDVSTLFCEHFPYQIFF